MGDHSGKAFVFPFSILWFLRFEPSWESFDPFAANGGHVTEGAFSVSAYACRFFPWYRNF